MDIHRCVSHDKICFEKIVPPFSSFDYVEKHFGSIEALRRIFSLGRSFNAQTLIIENISSQGILDEEDKEIKELYPDYIKGELKRISFWLKPIDSINQLNRYNNKVLAGYAIIKRDIVPSQKMDRWHIFESVFKKYPHPHNCVPFPGIYNIMIGNKKFQIPGLLYCQQNQLNKACAQVALRSLLSRLLPQKDISYKAINQIARKVSVPGWKPKNGLDVPQIRKVLDEFNLKYRDIDYSQSLELKKDIPYQKMAYSGLESGGGSLVGFRLSGKGLQEESRHIIPFYGHTFNKDTWAPDADVAYFHIGEDFGYIPSETWTSSYLGHDDNFGPNFCIPRLYIEQEKVEYVVEIFRPGVQFGGVQTEVLGLKFLYSIIPKMNPSKNIWLKRLINWTQKQRIVLRAIALEKEEYVRHLQKLRDWQEHAEDKDFSKIFLKYLPSHIWMIEISTPQLFPANQRKLGEIVLDATKSFKKDFKDFDVFLFARLPGEYLLGNKLDNTGSPVFQSLPSNLNSHTPLGCF
ncbi:MAG: hypothetical protein ACD_79C00511G0005 [uncultured bacterium]|nr:MAG: hypothetical protein ACD_79C00511G0005 [uncultured bacterium]